MGAASVPLIDARGDEEGGLESSQRAARLRHGAELLACFLPAGFIPAPSPDAEIGGKLEDEFFQSQSKLCMSSSCVLATCFLIGSLSKMPEVQTGITAVQHKEAQCLFRAWIDNERTEHAYLASILKYHLIINN